MVGVVIVMLSSIFRIKEIVEREEENDDDTRQSWFA